MTSGETGLCSVWMVGVGIVVGLAVGQAGAQGTTHAIDSVGLPQLGLTVSVRGDSLVHVSGRDGARELAETFVPGEAGAWADSVAPSLASFDRVASAGGSVDYLRVLRARGGTGTLRLACARLAGQPRCVLSLSGAAGAAPVAVRLTPERTAAMLRALRTAANLAAMRETEHRSP